MSIIDNRSWIVIFKSPFRKISGNPETTKEQKLNTNTGIGAMNAIMQQQMQGAGPAAEAAKISQNQQRQAAETASAPKTGELPLATEGTLGTRVNVSA